MIDHKKFQDNKTESTYRNPSQFFISQLHVHVPVVSAISAAHAKTLFSNVASDPEHRLHKYLQKWQSSVGRHSSRLRDAPIVINNYKITENSLFSKFIIWVLIKLYSFLMNYHFANYYFYSDCNVCLIWFVSILDTKFSSKYYPVL